MEGRNTDTKTYADVYQKAENTKKKEFKSLRNPLTNPKIQEMPNKEQ